MNANIRPAVVEGIGTFLLCFVVLAGSHDLIGLLPTPLAAALTLGMFVYVAGNISGSHLNPAVTIALASVRKISNTKAGFYIGAQLIGALLAHFIFKGLNDFNGNGILNSNATMFLETIGTFVLLFGIAAVVHGKVEKSAAGLAIGGSLLVGSLIASTVGGGAVNPAVALALWSFNPAGLLAPIVGAVASVWVFRMLVQE